VHSHACVGLHLQQHCNASKVNGHNDVIQLMIHHGANPKHQDAMGFNCLCVALNNKSLQCADWLLAQPFAGDLMGQVTKGNETVLHVAVDAFGSIDAGSSALCKSILYKLLQGSLQYFNIRSVENVTAVEKAIQLQRQWFISTLTDYASAVLADAIITRTFNPESPLILFANSNATDCHHNPLLYLAVCKRDAAAVQFLVAAGADVNCCAPDGWTALLAASALGDGGICAALLERSADVHATLASSYNCTPLQLAAAGGMSDVISRLLSRGALLDGRNDLGLNAVHLALLQGHRDIAFTLISSAKSSGKGNSAIAELLRTPQPPLMHRLLCSDIPESVMMKCVNLLLLLGFHVDDKDDEGRTPLQVALSENLPLVAAALGSHAKNMSGDSRASLFAAADACNADALRALLSHAEDVNCREFFDHGRPLLHAVVRACSGSGGSGHAGMIECISVMAGNPQCDVDVLDDQGCTPLHVAVALGCVAAAAALLAAGANCDSTSLSCSALFAALTAGHFDCVDRLLYFGANLMSPLGPHGSYSCVLAAVCSGRADVVTRVMSHVKMHHSRALRQICEMQVTSDGATLPLMWLEHSLECDNTTLDVLKLFLLGGSDVLQCNHSSVFPIQVATARSLPETSRFISSIAHSRLLSIVASPSPPPRARVDIHKCIGGGGRCDAADADGLLPLHVCAAVGSAAALDALVNSPAMQHAGAINALDSAGHNALCHAACNGRADLLPLLLRCKISLVPACGCSALAHAIMMQSVACVRVLLAAAEGDSGEGMVVLAGKSPGLGVDALQLACLLADVDIVHALLETSSSSSSLRSTVYDDGGCIVHYLASLQHHKHADTSSPPPPSPLSSSSSTSTSSSSAGTPIPAATRLAMTLAQAGAAFLRRNAQVQFADVVYIPIHTLRLSYTHTHTHTHTPCALAFVFPLCSHQGLTAVDLFRLSGDVETAGALEGNRRRKPSRVH